MKGAVYSQVTEAPGVRVSQEALSMLYSRYRTGTKYSRGRDVLEVACGAGHGLGYLSRYARRIVGGDFDERLIRQAGNYYKEKIRVLRLDAHRLPFKAASFDVVLLYEAIYYLEQPELFIRECRRVLREEGQLLICTVNREWPDFNPSPYSIRYFSGRELVELLTNENFQVELYGCFPVTQETLKARTVSILKRTAVKLHLIPKTMKGKELLKRAFLGKLVTLPAEIIEEMGEYSSPVALSADSPISNFKILFAAAQVRCSES